MTAARKLIVAVLGPALALGLAAPMAVAASVEVVGARLKVTLPQLDGGTQLAKRRGVLVTPIEGGGASVAFYSTGGAGSAPTIGAGCQEVSASSVSPNLGDPRPGGTLLQIELAASCNLTGVRMIDGRLPTLGNASTDNDGGVWRSSLNLPTTVATDGSSGRDSVVTGTGGDTISTGLGDDFVAPGPAPYKGQQALPNIGHADLDDPNVNVISGGDGDDRFELGRSVGPGAPWSEPFAKTRSSAITAGTR